MHMSFFTSFQEESPCLKLDPKKAESPNRKSDPKKAESPCRKWGLKKGG